MDARWHRCISWHQYFGKWHFESEGIHQMECDRLAKPSLLGRLSLEETGTVRTILHQPAHNVGDAAVRVSGD